jgi:hemerythrin-like domain-containing protein
MIKLGEPKSTLDKPLEHLRACHRRIEDRLDTLERVIPHLAAARRDEALAAIRNAIAFLDESGVRHTEDEEQSLFPRLYAKTATEDAAFLAHLENDHQDAEAQYARLKQIVASGEFSEYAATVARLCAIYRRHIQEEDTMLTPLGERLLSEADLAEIAAEMRRRRGQ